MTRKEAISVLNEIENWEGEDMPVYDTDVEAVKMAIKSIEKLQRIEQIINDPLVKAIGSISTNKIREILGEEDKTCQMQ